MKQFWQAVAKQIQEKDVVLVDSFFPEHRQLEDMQKQLEVELGKEFSLGIEAIWFTTPDWLTAKQYVQRNRLPSDNMYDLWHEIALENTRRFWSTAIHLQSLIPTIWEVDPRQGILGSPALRLALPM